MSVLLVALGISGYFYIIKSQIEKDFEIAYEPYIYADLAYEEHWSGYEARIYDPNTGSSYTIRDMNGTILAAAIPYYYNNTPYIILISYKKDYPLGGASSNYTIKVYNPITKEIVDQAYFYGPRHLTILWDLNIIAYTQDNKKVITLHSKTYGLTLHLSKVVVEDAMIKEIKTYMDAYRNVSKWLEDPYTGQVEVIVYFLVIFEGNSSDYIVVYYYNYTGNTYYLRIFDESGNILFDKSWQITYMHISFYESKDYVFIGAINPDNNIISILIYNKNNRGFYFYENTNVSIYNVEMSHRYIFGNYNKNRIATVGTDPMHIFTEDTGIIQITLDEVYTNISDQRRFVGGILADDKIILYDKLFSSLFYDPNIKYRLYNYSINENNIDVSLISKGNLVNVPNLLNWVGGIFFASVIPETTPLYLHNNKYNIIYSWENYVPLVILIDKYGGGHAGIYGLVDLNNYRIYPIVFFNSNSNETYKTSWREGNNFYNYMYLSPVICENYEYAVYNDTQYEYSINTTCKVYMFYVNATLLGIIKEDVDRSWVGSQQGSGVMITPTTPTLTETNMTQPNITQNVKTTRPTGVQTIIEITIEIIRMNWWLILLAILLILLIIARSRRKTSNNIYNK